VKDFEQFALSQKQHVEDYMKGQSVDRAKTDLFARVPGNEYASDQLYL